MMKNRYKIWGIGLLMGLMSCSEQEIVEVQSQGKQITATAVSSGSTSVFSRLGFEDKKDGEGGVGITWANGDKFDVVGTNASAEMAICTGQGEKTAKFMGVLTGSLSEGESVDVYYPAVAYDVVNGRFDVDFRTITQDCTAGEEMNHLSATFLMTGSGTYREGDVEASFAGGTKVAMLRFDLTLPQQTTSGLTINQLQIVCEDLKTVGKLSADGETFIPNEELESHRQKVVLTNLAASTKSETQFSVYVNVLPIKITGNMRLKAMLSDETVYWCDVDLTNVTLQANNRYYLVRAFLEEQKVGVDYSWYNNNATPLTIDNEAQLRALVHLVNGTGTYGKTDMFKNQTIQLSDDIDLKVDWIPLGCYRNGNREFQGNFDGQNHRITGLFYDDNHTVDVRYVGFIGRATGTIENLTVEGIIKSKEQIIAGLVGRTEEGVIVKNCRSEVDIVSYHSGNSSNSSYVGGIVGYGKGISLIKCSNLGSIENAKTSSGCLGGIVGCINGSIIMLACSNEGSMNSLDEESVRIGGIIGFCDPGLSSSKNMCMVASCNLIDFIGGENTKRFVGGLMGKNYGAGGEVNVDIYGCYSLYNPLCLRGKIRDRVTIDESSFVLTHENKNSSDYEDLLNGGIYKWNTKEDGVNDDVNHSQYCNYHFEVGETHLVLKEGAPTAPAESKTDGEL